MTDYNSAEFWKLAPDWAGAVISGDGGSRYWVTEWGIKSIRQRLGMHEIDHFEADMANPDNSWSLLATRPARPWSGDGLPPVGTFVRIADDGSLYYGRGESGEVLAHVEDCAVVRMSYGLGCFAARYLEPIKTPAQIAAGEREAAAVELAGILSGHDHHIAVRDIEMAKYLYDIGYRRTEKGDDK